MMVDMVALDGYGEERSERALPAELVFVGNVLTKY